MKLEKAFDGRTNGFMKIEDVWSIEALDLHKQYSLDKLDLTDCWLAGGAVRDYLMGIPEPKDIDIFTPSLAEFLLRNSEYILSDEDTALGFTNVEIIGCKYTVQIIETKHARSIRDLLMDFDFRCCRFLYHEGRIYYEAGATSDLANKKLVLRSYHTIPLSLTRMVKYLERGWSIERESIAEAMMRYREYGADKVEKQLDLMCQGFEYGGLDGV